MPDGLLQAPRSHRILAVVTLAAAALLAYLAWFPIPFTSYPAPDWSGAQVGDDTELSPLSRKLLFFHPALAWSAFVAYTVVLGCSIAYLNERRLRFDRAGRAAAEVGFLLNTAALATGTLWGLRAWVKEGQGGLATVYSEPKVLVVVVLWLAFAAYLLLRRLVDGQERRARLAAVFGILGFIGVPLSFATSRLLQKSLHPDVLGPGANADAAVSFPVELVLFWSFITFSLAFTSLWLWRRRIGEIEARAETLEEETAQASDDATLSGGAITAPGRGAEAPQGAAHAE